MRQVQRAVDSDLTTQRRGIREKHDKKPTQANLLLALAESAELWHCPDILAYATFTVNNHRETYPVRSSGFRNWLTHRFYQATDSGPSAQAMEEAIRTIEAKARYSGVEHRMGVRVAEHQRRIYLDLCDPSWQAVEITQNGWRVIDAPPVRFRRAKGMQGLPLPVTGGTLDDFRPFLNIHDDTSFRLVVGHLVMALNPNGPYPILLLEGEQGSAKTTCAKALRSLVDPSTSAVRTIPRDERDLAIAANNGWMVAYDNLSG
jgi:hypothetical protein